MNFKVNDTVEIKTFDGTWKVARVAFVLQAGQKFSKELLEYYGYNEYSFTWQRREYAFKPPRDEVSYIVATVKPGGTIKNKLVIRHPMPNHIRSTTRRTKIPHLSHQEQWEKQLRQTRGNTLT